MKSILREAESVLNIELKDESDNVMTTEEMQRRTDDILSQMDARGVSDKKLRKAVTTVKDKSVPKILESFCERYGTQSTRVCADSGYGSEMSNQRTIVVNHRNNELRAMARELLTSDEGLMHRSRRPIEPEAEFAAIAIAHNIRKMISKGYNVHSELVVG